MAQTRLESAAAQLSVRATGDVDRFETIGTILRSMARDMEIIMSTCYHNRHRRLGLKAKCMDELKRARSQN